MSAADESETLLNHSTERVNPNVWRVIGNPTRRSDPGAHELKTLIRTMQKGRRSPGRRKVDETEPPEAA
jgi:hypothetical protein